MLFRSRSLCDAIAINSAAAAVVAGLALALTGFMAHRAWSLRIVAIVGACGLALAVFALLEPRCMRGPFVMVDPAIRPIWLDHVREFQPLLAVFRTNPLTAAGIAAFPAAAALAALALARSSDIRDTFSYAITVAAFALAALATCADRKSTRLNSSH